MSSKQKITDLNVDCMEMIFNHLELDDLLNIADSSKQFYEASCRVYRRKYLNMNLVFHRFDLESWAFPQKSGSPSGDVEANVFNPEDNPVKFINTPLMVFKLLRNYGYFIRNLGIGFDFKEPNYYHDLNVGIGIEIENYLAEYCSDSLERFVLMSNKKRFPFQDLQKPFKNVTALKIITYDTQKGDHIQYLNENNFPNLKYIYFRSLWPNMQDSEVIHYRNIEYFTLDGYKFKKFPFSFGSLKHLILLYGFYVNDAFYEFIASIKHLKTLTLMILYFDSMPFDDLLDKLSKLQNIQSNLEEMQFGFKEDLSADKILHFMKYCKKLRKLSIHYDSRLDNSEYHVIVKRIASNLDSTQ